MRNRGVRVSVLVVGLLTCVLPIGCGSGGTSVSGTVSLDGEPVEKGSILFLSSTSPDVKATGVIENGRYTIGAEQNLQPGKYRVEIRWAKPTGKMIPVEDDPPNTIEERKEAIPSKYNANSDLLVELESGSKTEDFALRSK